MPPSQNTSRLGRFPRLLGGVAIVGALYMLLNAAVQYVLPADVIANSPRPASDAMALVLGRAGAAIVSAGCAWLITSP